jgi:hypothetical protein
VKEIYYANGRTDCRMICGKCLTKACDFHEHEHPATMRTQVQEKTITSNNNKQRQTKIDENFFSRKR